MSNDGEEYRYVKRERETPTPPGSSEMKKARVSPAAPGRAANGLPPMSHSFIGIEPIDEFIVEIADWIHGLVKSRPPGAPGVIEVEAKLGWLKYRESDDRVQFPVRNETSKQLMCFRSSLSIALIYEKSLQVLITGSSQICLLCVLSPRQRLRTLIACLTGSAQEFQYVA